MTLNKYIQLTRAMCDFEEDVTDYEILLFAIDKLDTIGLGNLNSAFDYVIATCL